MEYYLADASDETYGTLIEFYRNNWGRLQSVKEAVSVKSKNHKLELDNLVKYIATASSKGNADKCAAIVYRLLKKEKEFLNATKPELISKYISRLMELAKTISNSDNDCYAKLLQIIAEKSLDDLPKFLSDEGMLDRFNKLVTKLDSSKKYTMKQEKFLYVIFEYYLSPDSSDYALALIDQIESVSELKTEAPSCNMSNMVIPEGMQKIQKALEVLNGGIQSAPLLKHNIKRLAATLKHIFDNYSPEDAEARERADRTIDITLKNTSNGNLTGAVLYASQKMNEAKFSEEDSTKILKKIATAKGINQAKVAACFVACWAAGNCYDSNLESIVEKIVKADVDHSGKFKVRLSIDEQDALFIHGMTFSPKDGKVYYDNGTTITAVKVEDFLSDINLSEYFDCKIPYFYNEVMETGDGSLQVTATNALDSNVDTNAHSGYTRIRLNPIKPPKNNREKQ